MTPEQIAGLFLDRDDYLILTHIRPDGDTLGSAGALCRALRKLGKTAFVADNPETTPRYAFLTDGLIAPEDYGYKTIIAVDIADERLIPVSMRYGKPFVQIDHHPSNEGFAENNCIIPSAAATGEIIYEVMVSLKVEMDRDMAAAIYISVATDTGCFKYSNTTADSHTVAAAAISAGIRVGELNNTIFDAFSKARIEMERLFFESMRFYNDERICVARITNKMLEDTGASEDDIDNFAAIPKRINGVDAGITLRELRDGRVKVSFRSSEVLNASEICGLFGGGGHQRAAGATIEASLDEVEEMLVRAAGERLS